MMTIKEIKNRLILQKSILRNRYRVNRLGIFGSYVRGDQTDKSDIDILIDYEETPSLVDLIELEYFLVDVLNSRIDLVTPGGIKPSLKERIMNEVIYI